jgi:hypothetical protein
VVAVVVPTTQAMLDWSLGHPNDHQLTTTSTSTADVEVKHIVGESKLVISDRGSEDDNDQRTRLSWVLQNPAFVALVRSLLSQCSMPSHSDQCVAQIVDSLQSIGRSLKMPSYAIPSTVLCVAEPFTQHNGLLTRSFKVPSLPFQSLSG